ncbi:hypothetical protein NG798_04970 [Ancylothrix sp. C2]|uniref:hypothetical protein n=1 Tax=Ancylothrix sp. D3o TaxID=2953691 RepID=UPI0021BB7651|nr:hypothetical protein [Ancylothrix sp. D3o]MCT7949131.1 hypothetical protein [Ancylothrix sp. D3o]
MTDIIDPTLDLFLYHKRGAGGDEETEIAKNQANFAANFPDNVKPDFTKESTAESTEYLPLLKPSSTIPDIEDNGYKIPADYYAVLLADTYGLFYTSCLTDDTTPQDISCLQNLKKQVTDKSGDIGKTWMISACLQTGDNAETVAKDIYEKTFPGMRWQNKQDGKFFNADIFEISQPPTAGKSREESHVLIILFPTAEDKAKLGKLTKTLIKLLCYRHKIIWSYQQTRECKHELQKVYQSIRNTIEGIRGKFNTNELTHDQLNELEKILKTNLANLYDYGNQLNSLEMYKQTIEVNLNNYKLAVKTVSDKVGVGQNNLKFLEDFSELTEKKYSQQIDKDYASLSPGLRLLENLINTIRGIVEIEQTQINSRIETQNRNFQNLVAVAGVGISTASLTATGIAPLIQQITTPPTNQPTKITNPSNQALSIWIGFFILCLLFGGFCAGFTYWWRTRNNPKKQP